ncbi:hypothetical protein, partial [Nocardioides sp.]|uniref:hypothetical protein n=1 Tax=Nocardioides sp. TaxID=35761 RepID=UPI002B27AA7A
MTTAAGGSGGKPATTRGLAPRDLAPELALALLGLGLLMLGLGDSRPTRFSAGALLVAGGLAHLWLTRTGRRTGPASGLVTVGVLAGVALMLVPVQADRVLTLVT